MRVHEMTGQQFGRLTVLRRAGTERSGQATWECKCSCGNAITANGSNLRTGTVKSCGCLLEEVRRAKMLKHGQSDGIRKDGTRRIGHPLYRIWSGIRRRCMLPNHQAYARYGGRGITIHETWRDDFVAFARDVGERPSPQHSLDRIDNDGPYAPGNVRWATSYEQAQNRGRMTEMCQKVHALTEENIRLVVEVRQRRAANKLLWEVLSLRTDVLVRLIEFAESEAKVDSRFGVWDDARASIASTAGQLQEAMRLDTPPVACHNPPPARVAVEGSNGEKDQPVGGSEDA